MGRLEGKVALVTGAASGIGAACALRFAEEGAAVAGLDLAEPEGGDWAEAAKRAPAARFQVADVRDEPAVAAAVAAVRAGLGRIDVLVNSAGVAGGGRVHLMEVADWERVLDVNLKGTFLVSRHVVPVMLEQGAGASSTWRAWRAWRASRAGARTTRRRARWCCSRATWPSTTGARGSG